MNSMKRRPIFLLLAGVMVLSLAACSHRPRRGRDPSAPAVVPTPEVRETHTPTLEPSPVPLPSLEPIAIQEGNVPPGEYAPWQEAYVRFLEKLRGEEAPWEVWGRDNVLLGSWEQEVYAKIAASSDSYWLYDIDKDGIPELLVQYGDCEAAYHTKCYTYREGEVVCIGDFACGHTSLWSWPGENGILQLFYGVQKRLTIEEGGLSVHGYSFDIPQGYYEQKGLDWSQQPNPADFIPGTEYIPSHRIPADPGDLDGPVLALPIYDYGRYPRQAKPCLEERTIRSVLGRVLWGTEDFTLHSGDGWAQAGGKYWGLEEYLSGQEALTVEVMAWADANGDGQTDCILRLRGGEEEFASTKYIVFSLEEDGVQAYGFRYADGFGVDPDGTVYLRNGEIWELVSFYREQSYTFPANRNPVEGCDLAWDPFLPPEAAPDPEFTLPPGNYAPWQVAYMDFLTELCEREAPILRWRAEVTQEEWEAADEEQRRAVREVSREYWLYDVDKDGVPELFIIYGDFYYAPWIECYRYQKGKVASIGKINDAKGARFFTWPGKNAILDYWAWKGAFILWEYSIVDGELACMDEEGIASQFGGPGEPDPLDYVPGGVYIEPTSIRLARPKGVPMLLPICDYGGRTVPSAARAERAAGREAIQGALYRGEPFYGLPGGTSYDGCTGWVTFEEYCWEGTVERYEALVPKDKVWMDLDGDGAEECIVRFQDHNRVTVFHWQDGVVYAYYLGYYSYADGLTADGVFYFEEPYLWESDSWGQVLSFHQNQCYLSCVPRPENPVPAPWEPFST